MKTRSNPLLSYPAHQQLVFGLRTSLYIASLENRGEVGCLDAPECMPAGSTQCIEMLGERQVVGSLVKRR